LMFFQYIFFKILYTLQIHKTGTLASSKKMNKRREKEH